MSWLTERTVRRTSSPETVATKALTAGPNQVWLPNSQRSGGESYDHLEFLGRKPVAPG